MDQGEMKLESKFSIKLVVFFSIMLWIAVTGYADLVVYIEQPNYHVSRNDEITMTVYIEGVATDMRGFQLDFTYDPVYLEIADVSAFREGGFLSDVGRTQFMVSGTPGNYLVGNAITGITFGALGSGTLFSVTMKAIKATDDLGTDVLLNNIILRTPTNQAITVDRIEHSNVVIDAIMMYCQIKAFLQGAYVTGGTMRHDLTSYLPLVSPYNSAEVITALPDVSPNYIVDWVQVQLRATYNGPILQSQSCFLLEDGRVVDVNGNPNISFEYLDNLNYYVILRHRNHLGVMSAAPYSLSLEASLATFVDLSISGSAYGGDGSGAKVMEPGVLALFTGDVDGNRFVQNLDIYTYSVPALGLSGYQAADSDLNGLVQNIDIYTYTVPNLGNASQIP